ncbi:hypothetical protein A3850_000775 [Lewinella sp. 4G2]|nr:hypothetical protein A3850_000775 [Lewinella sp. 4G2]
MIAQVFVGPSGQVIPPGAPDETRGVTISEVTVTGIGTLSKCSVLERVFINIDHTYVGDVAIFVISPAGTVLELTSGNGGFRDNWRNTTFRDDATINIVNGNPPYTGTFQPEGRQQALEPFFDNGPDLATFTLANTFEGEDADGVWQLYVNDYVAVDVGEIIDWEIEFFVSDVVLTGELQASKPNICAGEEVDLSVVGEVPADATYVWSTGEATPTITVSPTEPTTYAVTVTAEQCELEVDLTITPTETPGIDGEAFLCSSDGESVELTAVGEGPFNWSNGASGPSITVYPTETTSYTVSNGTGACNTSEPFEVTVQPISLDLSASTNGQCVGEPVTLTAAGGSSTATYQWSTGEATPSITFNPTTSATYSVTLTEGTCTLTDEILVEAFPTAVALGEDRTICGGELLSLTPTGPGPFTWSTGEIADFILVTPSVTTTYTATATQGNCSVSDEITINVLPDAAVTAPADRTICSGEFIILEATGTGPFTWSDGQTGATITVSPSETTTYTVNVGSGACAASDEVTVTVFEQPTVDLGPDASYCADGPTTLTALGEFDAIQWSTGANTATIDLQDAGTVTYTATATIGTCSASDQVTIAIIPEVELLASADTAICAGGQAVLSAAGTGPFRWSTGEVGPTIQVSPDGLQAYTVTAGAGDCAITEEVRVDVDPLPVADLGNDRTVCITDEITLENIATEDDYSWSTGSTEPTVSITAAVDTSIFLTVTRGDCTASDTISVFVSAPRIDLGSDRTVCPGDSVSLEIPSADSYLWNNGSTEQSVLIIPTASQEVSVEATIAGCPARDTLRIDLAESLIIDAGEDISICPGESTQLRAQSTALVTWSTGVTGAELDVAPTENTFFFATIGSGNCAVTDSVLVSINPTASLDLGNDFSICLGSDTTLIPVGNSSTFNWSTGESSPSIAVAPDEDTTYEVTGTTAEGCTATDSLRITVIAPQLELAPVPAICPGDSLTLMASAAETYRWSSGEESSSIRRAPSETTSYGVTGFTAGCSVSEEIEVVVRPRATVTVTEDQTICPGDSILLEASGDEPFSWDTGFAGPSLNVRPIEPTTYLVRAGSGNCADSATVTVGLFPAVEASLGEDQAICRGDSVSLLASTGSAALNWEDGSFPTNRRVSPTATTTYSITASENGCTDSASVTVVVNDLPVVNLISTDCAPDNVDYAISVEISGGSPGYLLNGNPVATRVDSAGIPSGTPFTISVSDENACETTFSELINCGCQVIEFAPPALTCNGNENLTDLAEFLPNGGPQGSWSVSNPDVNGLPAVEGTALRTEGCAAGTYTLQFTPEGADLACLVDYRAIIEITDPPVAGIQQFVEDRCSETAEVIDLAAELSDATAGGSWTAISTNAIGNAGFNAAAGTFTPTNQPSGEYTFRYQAPDGIDCPGEAVDVVIRLSSTSVAGTVAAPDCEEACSGSITVLNPGATNLYGLDGAALSNEVSFASLCSGTYQLSTEDDRGCTAVTELTVPETIIPTLSIAGVDRIGLGDSTLLQATTNVSVDTIEWSQPVRCLDPECRSVYVRPLRTADYRVTIASEAGCVAQSQITIFVDERVSVYVPTAFSPNGDGVNDRLTVFAGDDVATVLDLQIFDRWGNRVASYPEFPPGNEDFGWDGSAPDGELYQTGVYIYNLRFVKIDGTEGKASGEVVLMR